jgi:uncharacterized protein
MIRVVLDTNIVVSTLFQPLGPPARVFQLAIDGLLQPCETGAIYAEYEEVVRRPRLRRPEYTIVTMLGIIREKALWVRPGGAVRACTDPDDDIFLECAQAARAAYLVTGNIRHFPATWLDTRIVTPGHFLDILAAEAQQGSL